MRSFSDMVNRELYSYFSEGNHGISVDSRKVRKDDIFFALKGEQFDGNSFARDALERGAALAVIDNHEFEIPGTLVVDDVLTEMQNLAAAYRKDFVVPVLAITGTNGKTTTKELIAAVLKGNRKLHYTPGNLNNHIGVPITLLTAPADTEFIIVEMGANHIGEIERLCNMADPQYGIITNIGRAHLEGFGSFDGVVKAKSELYSYMAETHGMIFYNPENNLLKEIIEELKVDSRDYYNIRQGMIENIKVNENSLLSLSFNLNNKNYTVKTNLFGSYNSENVFAAFCAGSYFGVTIEDIIDAIESYFPENNRSQLITSKKGNRIVCDSYNANPVSMRNAIQSFMDVNNGPRTMILGDMLELGEYSNEDHLEIFELALSYDDVTTFFIGPNFSRVAERKGAMIFKDIAGLIGHLEENPLSDNFILVKGSRGIRLDDCYDLL